MKVQSKSTERLVDVSVLGSKDGELQVKVDDAQLSFALSPEGKGAFRVEQKGTSFDVYVIRDKKGTVWVHDGTQAYAFTLPEEGASSAASGKDKVVAPTPGKIVAINVAVGDQVEEGDSIVVLEAMKMEQRLSAEIAGEVAEILVAEQEQVDSDTVLVRIEASNKDEA